MAFHKISPNPFRKEGDCWYHYVDGMGLCIMDTRYIDTLSILTCSVSVPKNVKLNAKTINAGISPCTASGNHRGRTEG